MIATEAATFRATLPEGGRLLGLDVGTKTIGTALCDAGWTIASAAELLHRGKFGKDLERLKALAEAQRVAGIVIGLPLNMDGSESPRSQSTAPSPATSRRWACRSCSGTSAGRPRRSPAP
jgi:putative Holliday junction resolvase